MNMKNVKNRRSIKDMFGKRFRAGSYSAFSAAVVIAIAVIVNLLVGALPTTITQPDITSQSLYSLSAQSRRIGSGVTEDVELYLLCSKGSEDATIQRLLGRYGDLSDHIHVTEVDPGEQPTFLNSYDLGSQKIYQNSVLVDCNGRYRLVGYDDIYVTEYTTDSYTGDYSYTTTFDGENALTNAIHYVTSADLPKLYTLTGHGEAGLDSYVADMIQQDNMETEELSLLSLESVPEDADAIIIHVPQNDISEDEAACLIEYLDNGGSIALITDYIEEGSMKNLLSVTEHMGLTIQNGLVVEGDSSMHLSRYPYYLLPDISSHEITDELIDGGYYILMPLAQALLKTDDTTADVTFLLKSSSDAYAKADGVNAQTTDYEEGDVQGSFKLAAVSELNEGKMFWFPSANMLNENVDYTVAGANTNLFLNGLGWMCDQPESISIRGKELEDTSLVVPSAQGSLWSGIMIAGIPLAFIAVGIVVCIRRKRR